MNHHDASPNDVIDIQLIRTDHFNGGQITSRLKHRDLRIRSHQQGGFSQSKLISVTFKNGGVAKEQLQPLGEVLEHTKVKAVLKVPREKVKKASNDLLTQFDVDDINIEEVPIEEVIEKVFKTGGTS